MPSFSIFFAFSDHKEFPGTVNWLFGRAGKYSTICLWNIVPWYVRMNSFTLSYVEAEVTSIGTPHNGSSLANMGKVVANILYACSPLKSAHALLGILQKNSEALLEITADFVKRRRKVHLISFYEMEMTAITPFLKRLVRYPLIHARWWQLTHCYRSSSISRQS